MSRNLNAGKFSSVLFAASVVRDERPPHDRGARRRVRMEIERDPTAPSSPPA
jgi:hypothetical protein